MRCVKFSVSFTPALLIRADSAFLVWRVQVQITGKPTINTKDCKIDNKAGAAEFKSMQSDPDFGS